MVSANICETCGESASVQVTEKATHGFADHYFCEKHAPQEVIEQHARSKQLRDEIIRMDIKIIKGLEECIAYYEIKDMDAARKEKMLALLHKMLARYSR